MANNRTEANSAIDTALVPTLTLAQHKTLLKDEITSSIVFRKDIIASETPAAGSVTVDFSNKDTATISTTANLAISFTGLENGDIKTIALTKDATNTVSFVGATDVSPRKLYINTSVTYIEYEVRNKNGIITVNSKNIDGDITTEITDEIDAAILASNGGVKTKIYDLGDWDMNSTASISFEVINDLGLDASKIRSYRTSIRPDVGASTEGLVFDLDINLGVISGWTDMVIALTIKKIVINRVTSGFFDSADFDATSYNRGWLIVEYVD